MAANLFWIHVHRYHLLFLFGSISPHGPYHHADHRVRTFISLEKVWRTPDILKNPQTLHPKKPIRRECRIWVPRKILVPNHNPTATGARSFDPGAEVKIPRRSALMRRYGRRVDLVIRSDSVGFTLSRGSSRHGTPAESPRHTSERRLSRRPPSPTAQHSRRRRSPCIPPALPPAAPTPPASRTEVCRRKEIRRRSFKHPKRA